MKEERDEQESEGSDEVEPWLRDLARVPRLSPGGTEETLPAPSSPSSAKNGRLAQAGDTLEGRYRLEEVLGEGGMGVVFTATQLATGKQVAIKCMRPRERSADEQARALERFMREAKAAARIAHPNVVDVYDVSGKSDAPYLVMERLRGESLRLRIDRAALDWDEAVWLIAPVMQALAMAHRAGVVHRDLKPDNLFLTQLPDGGQLLKVLDFGISQLQSQDEDQRSLTRTGALLGTPVYMSLEQLHGDTELDGRTDVFALGVVLYEMLTQQRPYAARNAAEYGAVLASQPPRALSTLVPELAGAREAVVMKALQRQREARFADMDAFRDALLGVDEHGPLPRAVRREPPRVAQSSEGPAPAHGAVTTDAERGRQQKRTRARLWLLASSMLGMAAAGVAVNAAWPEGAPAGAMRQERIVERPHDAMLLAAALSPDSKSLALSDMRGLFIVDMRDGSERPIAGVGHPECLTWISNRELLVTLSEGKGFSDQSMQVARLSTDTGRLAQVPLAPSPSFASSLYLCPELSPDQATMLSAQKDGLYLSAVDGTGSRRLTTIKDETPFRAAWSPDGKWIAVVMSSMSDYHSARIEMIDVGSGARHVVVDDPSVVALSAGVALGFDRQGRLLFGRTPRNVKSDAMGLYALPLRDGKAAGEPTLVLPTAYPLASMKAGGSGRWLALLQHYQTDVYAAPLGPAGDLTETPRRLTISDGIERLSDVTRNGDVLLSRGEGGSFAPFRLEMTSGSMVRLSEAGRYGGAPVRWGDSDEVAYVKLDPDAGPRAPAVFVLASAPSVPLFRTSENVQMEVVTNIVPPLDVRMRCGDDQCVIMQRENGGLTVWAVEREPLSVEPLTRLAIETSENFGFALSHDASHLAVAPRLGSHPVLIFDRQGTKIAEHALPDECIIQGVSFAGVQGALYVTGMCDEPRYAIFYIAPDGSSRVVHSATDTWLNMPVVAPDGSFVAFGQQTLGIELLLFRED